MVVRSDGLFGKQNRERELLWKTVRFEDNCEIVSVVS